MRRVDTIFESFPGPVTLYQSRLKLIAIFAMCLVLAVFSAVVLIPKAGEVPWYETVMSVLAFLICGFAAVKGALMLLLRNPMSLTLDADGFESHFLFRHDRFRWQDVSGFCPQADDVITPGIPIGDITFEVRSANAIPQHHAAALPDNYQLPKDDLAWLMEQWRQRALAQQT
jgi:hypothetical protein